MSFLRNGAVVRVIAAAGLVSLGCGVELGAEAANGDEDAVSNSSEIIGGSNLVDPVATRRLFGLVEVVGPRGSCSGALTNRDWVLTATHCLDATNGFGNRFRIPRDPSAGPGPAGATYDERFGDSISVLENSDMALVHLWQAPAGSTWPTVTRAASSAVPSTLVGQSIICYGQGITTYASPPSTLASGAGTWKSLTKTVATTRPNLGGTELVINATTPAIISSGSEIPARVACTVVTSLP